MVDVGLRRRIFVLCPSRDGRAVLVTGAQLPVIDATLTPGDGTITAAANALAAIGLTGAILECAIDQTSTDELGGVPRGALAQLHTPGPEWTPPPGWAWLPWDELMAWQDVEDPRSALPPSLVEVADVRIAELTGDAPVPEARAAWSHVGWYERATDWIEHSLRSAGRAAPDAIVQVRHWGISALMRADATDGSTWFKASFPHFHNEVSISELLAQLAPGATCDVIATDPSNGWILLDQLEGVTDAADSETSRRAVDHLVALERGMLAHEPALRTAGCSHRPLTRLAADLRVSLGADAVVAQLGLTPERAGQLVDAVADAAARVGTIGLPETLLHGDFHPGNVALHGDDVVLFDWSDGAIGSPVIEAATWGWWFEDDEPRLEELWQFFCSAWHREFGIDASGLARADVDMVAGAYHLVSYERIVTALEPTERPSHADGLEHFYGLLTQGVDRHSLAD